jgi:c-di-GMP-binding flagellar brake protein YcgR
MTQNTSLIAICKDDIDIGKPLPWSIYTHDRHLLLRRGFVLESQSQLDGLSDNEFFRFTTDDASHVSRPGTDDVGERAKSDPATERSIAFDEIKLAIGDALQIQTQVEQSESRYYVKLIGYLKGKGVLVTAPQVEGNLCYIKEGQTFVVRFFAGKNAYAFTTSVNKVTNVPFPHLYLSYPPQVRGLVVRSGERVNVRIICTVSVPDDAKTVAVPGMLTNISVGGALLAAKKELGAKNDLLVVKFRVFIRDIEFFMTIDAMICSLVKDDSGEILHGLRFAGLPNDMAIALTAYVYQKLAESNM